MDFVEKLEQWANVNSYSHNSIGLEKMLLLAKEAFAALNPDRMETLPIGLFLEKRKKASLQVFLGGHLDTVFPPDSPFQTTTRLDSNRLQGPGVTDMKGGILILLHALLDFESSSYAKELGWEIFLNLDEEIGSPNSTSFLQSCSQRCHYALLFEPTLPDGSFVNKRKGSTNYLITSKGKKAHAGRHPEEGKNAIYPLARFITSIQALNDEETLVNVGTIEGGRALNIVPDYAEAKLNVRFIDDPDTNIKRKAQEAGVSLKKLSQRPPKPFDVQTEKLFNLLYECGEKLHLKVKWRASGGVCDGNTFGAAGIPTIDTLGVNGSGAHTEEECVDLSSIPEKVKLTALLLEELARRMQP